MLAREIRLFFTAWMFFTRIPLPARLAAWVGYDDGLMNGASRHFPLIGLLVGAVAAGVYTFGMWLFTPMVAVALSMAAAVLVTGAFHEDGFADVCDGFGATRDRERVMQIMKDSRIGAFGAIGVALILLIKFTALAGLADHDDGQFLAWILVIGHMLSRAMPVLLIYTMQYVRPDDDAKAKPMAQAISLPGLIIALIWGLAPFGGLIYYYEDGWLFALGVVPVVLAMLLMAWWFKRRIGGYTGDCLGAVQQVTELVFYLYALALMMQPVDDGGAGNIST